VFNCEERTLGAIVGRSLVPSYRRKIARNETSRWVVDMKEWEKYKIKGDLAEAGAELATVRHIAHVPDARRIIEDGKIKAGLVYDESRLNRSRISVSWVSANTWVYGSIYGTVEFQFDWETLIEGKKVYWVEAITRYNPTAYRFLLTTGDLNASSVVEPYNPIKDDGPLRKSGNRWYWNGDNLTSEFMIDDDLHLRKTTGLNFVSHHPQLCRAFGSSCVDRRDNPTRDETGGRVLAYVLGHEIHVLDKYLKPTGGQDRNQLLDTAYNGLHAALYDETDFGGPLHNAASCEKVVTGALALYGMDQLRSALDLLTLLKSAEGLNKALAEIVRKHFRAPDWIAPF
jgi:hypothetical protein